MTKKEEGNLWVRWAHLRIKSVGKLSTKGRTCGAWQLREPGYTCS